MARKQTEPMEQLVKRRFDLWREVVNTGDFVRGSVVELRRPCARPRCQRCASGERHPAMYLSMKEKGRTRLVYLPKAMVEQARRWVEAWRRLEALLAEISRTNAEVLKRLGQEGAQRRGKSRERSGR